MKYAYTDHIVLRMPRYPESYIHRALSDEDFFESLVSSDDFKVALYLVSPSLSQEHEKYLDGKLKAKESARLRNTLLKYLARMSTRCTPFATLASCATAEVGESDHLVLAGDVKPSFRPDMLSLCSLSQAMQRDAGMRHSVGYRANTSIYGIGRKLRFVAYTYRPNGRSYTIEQVENSSLLGFVLKLCQSGYVAYDDIVRHITSQYELSEAEAGQYVDMLIANQLLVGEIEPFITGGDYFTFLKQKVEECGSAENKASIGKMADALAGMANAHTAEECDTCYGEMAEALGKYGIKCDKKFLVQADSMRKLARGTVSRQLVAQLGECLSVLNKITPRTENSNLADFRRRFMKRYDTQEVTLLEALDPDVGIGYTVKEDKVPNTLIAGLRLPPSKAQAMGQLPLTPLNVILLKKLVTYNQATDAAIELTDDDVKDLKENWNDLPLSMAAFFRVTGKNADGCYRLANVHFSGMSAANMLSRFAYCDKSVESIVKTVTRHEQASAGEALLAEIAHISESRTGNILARPHIRDYEIAYLTNSTMSVERVIAASDLLVSVSGQRIVLRSKQLGREIVPRLTTAHNYHNNTTPVYRFLCDLQLQAVRPSLGFSWGGLDTVLEHLPRVVYRHSILSLARWRLSKEPFMEKSGIADMAKVAEWRAAKRLPREVNLVMGDNKLFVDLENPRSVAMLVEELPGNNRFVLEEYIPSRGYLTDADGNSYNNEFIVPYVRL